MFGEFLGGFADVPMPQWSVPSHGGVGNQIPRDTGVYTDWSPKATGYDVPPPLFADVDEVFAGWTSKNKTPTSKHKEKRSSDDSYNVKSKGEGHGKENARAKTSKTHARATKRVHNYRKMEKEGLATRQPVVKYRQGKDGDDYRRLHAHEKPLIHRWLVELLLEQKYFVEALRQYFGRHEGYKPDYPLKFESTRECHSNKNGAIACDGVMHRRVTGDTYVDRQAVYTWPTSGDPTTLGRGTDGEVVRLRINYVNPRNNKKEAVNVAVKTSHVDGALTFGDSAVRDALICGVLSIITEDYANPQTDAFPLFYGSAIRWRRGYKVCCFQEHIHGISLYRHVMGIVEDYRQRYAAKPRTKPHKYLKTIQKLALTALFRMLFALAVGNKRFGFVHCDLHCGNAMLQETHVVSDVYKANGKSWLVPTCGYFVRVIDFGRSGLRPPADSGFPNIQGRNVVTHSSMSHSQDVQFTICNVINLAALAHQLCGVDLYSKSDETTRFWDVWRPLMVHLTAVDNVPWDQDISSNMRQFLYVYDNGFTAIDALNTDTFKRFSTTSSRKVPPTAKVFTY